jgi:hypothetical protein
VAAGRVRSHRPEDAYSGTHRRPFVRSGGLIPRLLRPSLLGNRELLLRETHATPMYYLPGPTVALAIALYLDLAAYSSAVDPYGLFGRLPTIAGHPPTGGGGYVLLAFLVLTLLVLLLVFVRYLQWIRTVYAVTSTRVIIQRGILARDFDEIPIGQVRGIDVHQTLVERLLGYGSMQVSSEGGSSIGKEIWRGIPRPFQFQRDIENAAANLLRPAPAAAPPAATAPPYPPAGASQGPPGPP